MRRLIGSLIVALAALVMAGCGGGGGGGSVTLTGRVLLVGTETAPNPAATVLSGGSQSTTNVGTGNFTLQVSDSAVTLTVRTTGLPEFQFTLPALTPGQTVSLGDLYVGPTKVAVQGRTVDALDPDLPVAEAVVKLRGHSILTASTGQFTLNDVAYDADGLSEVPGSAERPTGTPAYLLQQFFLETPPVNNVIVVPDIALAPETGGTPPPPPGNVTGRVTAGLNNPIGTRIDIFQPPDATIPMRSQFITANTGVFGIWLAGGTYRITFTLNTGTGTLTSTINPVNVVNASTKIDLGTIALN